MNRSAKIIALTDTKPVRPRRVSKKRAMIDKYKEYILRTHKYVTV